MLNLLRKLSIAFILLFALLNSVSAEETLVEERLPLPQGTLNSDEIFYLFNDRTVHSVTAVRGRESISYYDPNGEIRQLRNDIKRVGRWRVTDHDRICLQMEDLPEKCRIIVEDNGHYKKYIVRKDGKHQHSVSYPRFLTGNVLGL